MAYEKHRGLGGQGMTANGTPFYTPAGLDFYDGRTATSHGQHAGALGTNGGRVGNMSGYGRPSMEAGRTPGVVGQGYGMMATAGGHGGGGGVGGVSASGGYMGSMGSVNTQSTGWLSAFGTGGFDGEAPLLEELGVNFEHIKTKSLAVLNPLAQVDGHIMDDSDLAGPLVFFLAFGLCLLASGRPQFGYIYGMAALGDISLYFLLNLMAEPGHGIDAYRTISVLGYCLLPLVFLSALSITISIDDLIGYIISTIAIGWCTYSASGMFVAHLRMHEQRLLVAYPVGLLYAAFALLTVFNVTTKR